MKIKHLRHYLCSAEKAFTEDQIVYALRRQLHWTHRPFLIKQANSTFNAFKIKPPPHVRCVYAQKSL